MDRITSKAYAKINLGLDVVGVRKDGYHDIRTPMHTIDLFDEIIVALSDRDKHTMESNIESIPNDDTNLCIKAVKLLDNTYGLKNKYHIVLNKNIPSQAGLGGGSADGACVLRAINEIEHLEIDPKELARIAAKLGADVPFCVLGGCMLAEGIGDKLIRLNSTIEANLLIIKPTFNISTAVAYREIDRHTDTTHKHIDDICDAINQGSLHRLAKLIDDANAFETVIKELHPSLENMMSFLRESGALGAGLSGSGSAFYGIFDSAIAASECKNKFCDRFDVEFIQISKTIAGG